MKEFRVWPADCGAEGKPAIDIAVMMGLDISKGYIGPKWNPYTGCFHYLGEERIVNPTKGGSRID